MRVLTDEHWHKLKEYLRLSEDPKDILVELALHTGARVSEVIRLKRENFRGDMVTIKSSKNSNDRRVQINEDLMLKVKLLDLTPKQTIFSLVSKSKGEKSMNYTMHRHVTTLTEWLLGEKYSMHALRHTILTMLYRRSGDVYLVMQWAGHKSINSTLKYMHYCQRENADMMIGDLLSEVK